MYLNRVILIGQIVSEPRLKEPARGRDDRKSAMLDFRLRVLRRQWKHEQMTIRVVVFGLGAYAFHEHKKRDEFVVISGRLCHRRFTGREGVPITHHYVVAEEFRFLWNPPAKFIKGHVVVPRDQWERWRAFEEEVGPWHIPKRVKEEVLGDDADRPVSNAAAAQLDEEFIAKMHTEWLEELDKPQLDMPSRYWGIEPEMERGFGKRSKRRT